VPIPAAPAPRWHGYSASADSGARRPAPMPGARRLACRYRADAATAPGADSGRAPPGADPAPVPTPAARRLARSRSRRRVWTAADAAAGPGRARPLPRAAAATGAAES
jgi:hypothetical protein